MLVLVLLVVTEFTSPGYMASLLSGFYQRQIMSIYK